jgi:predicted RNA polymerase sigma factor
MNATFPSQSPSRHGPEELCWDEEFITHGNELIARAHQVAQVIQKRVQTAIHRMDGKASKDELGAPQECA